MTMLRMVLMLGMMQNVGHGFHFGNDVDVGDDVGDDVVDVGDEVVNVDDTE